MGRDRIGQNVGPITVKLPAELRDRLDAAAADRGMNRSRFLRFCIELALDPPIPADPTILEESGSTPETRQTSIDAIARAVRNTSPMLRPDPPISPPKNQEVSGSSSEPIDPPISPDPTILRAGLYPTIPRDPTILEADDGAQWRDEESPACPHVEIRHNGRIELCVSCGSILGKRE